jgi:hypothetical protein
MPHYKLINKYYVAGLQGHLLKFGKATPQDLSLNIFLPVAKYPGFTHHAFFIPGLWRKTKERPVSIKALYRLHGGCHSYKYNQ